MVSRAIAIWRRFWGLSWRVKGPALGGGAAIFLIGIAILIAATTGDGGEPGAATRPRGSPTRTAAGRSPTPVPTVAATPAAAEPAATAAPAAAQPEPSPLPPGAQPIPPAQGSQGPVAFRYRSFVSQDNALHIIGELTNTRDQPIQFAKVSGTFYNAEDRSVASVFSSAYINVIPPGVKSPFDLVVVDAASLGITRVDFQVTFSEPSLQTLPGFELQGITTQTEPGTGWYHILGQVSNGSGQTAEFVKVVGTLYDAAGEVAGVAFAFTEPRVVAAGEVPPFDMLFDKGLLGTVASYALYVEASA